MLIIQQIMVAATFTLNHRNQPYIFHKIGHFQPFLKYQLPKHFSRGPPFAKIPKMADF